MDTSYVAEFGFWSNMRRYGVFFSFKVGDITMKKNIALFLIIIVTLINNSYSQDSGRLVHFLNTVEQLRKVHALLRIRQNIPERKEEAESKLVDALDKAEELQKQNTLCDDGMVVYLKARSINATDTATLDIIEVLLRDIKSPTEEETLKIANNWIGYLFKPRRDSPFLHARTILPMRGSYYSVSVKKSDQSLSLAYLKKE